MRELSMERRVVHGQAFQSKSGCCEGIRLYYQLNTISLHEKLVEAFVCIRTDNYWTVEGKKRSN